MNIEQIKKQFENSYKAIKTQEDLKNLSIEFLGKKGVVNDLMGKIKELSNNEKRQFGADVNILKNEMVLKIEEREKKFALEVINKKLQTEETDISIPARESNLGNIHPITKIRKELEEIFYSMGFVTAEGPEIEDDWHNFEALNTPPNHPARQMQDTFYMPDTEDGKKIVLRTQTSSVQIREMENSKPPFKFISMGKTYRVEMDATHTPMFHQIEGLYIDKNVTMANLKSCLMEFCKRFFEIEQAPLRFRPSYFPFVEPGIEIDVQCRKGDGILKLGEGENWLEILGAGMVHPNVIKNVGLDPEKYQGFAFGTGIERLAMLKYGVSDARMLYEGDIRFLKHYGFKFFE
jgi:phenylalanyl-tRNA synthetase alpha chain